MATKDSFKKKKVVPNYKNVKYWEQWSVKLFGKREVYENRNIIGATLFVCSAEQIHISLTQEKARVTLLGKFICNFDSSSSEGKDWESWLVKDTSQMCIQTDEAKCSSAIAWEPRIHRVWTERNTQAKH